MSLDRLPKRPARGFTLVELLVVIGIIAVLIGALLPALNKARQQANSVACQANLRQFGLGIQLYTNVSKGSLPTGTFDGTWDGSTTSPRNDKGFDWTVLLADIMGRHGQTWGDTKDSRGMRGVFKCPDARDPNLSTTPGGGEGLLHYSSHPRLMGNIEEWNGPGTISGQNWNPPYKIARIKQSSKTIIIFDGVQIGAIGWNSSSEAFALDAFRMFFDSYLRREIAQQIGMNPSSPIDAGTNKDSPDWGGNAGHPRFRHLRNTSGNFLFIDGHVEARRYVSATRNDVLRSNVLVTSMGSNEKR